LHLAPFANICTYIRNPIIADLSYKHKLLAEYRKIFEYCIEVYYIILIRDSYLYYIHNNKLPIYASVVLFGSDFGTSFFRTIIIVIFYVDDVMGRNTIMALLFVLYIILSLHCYYIYIDH